MGNLSIRGEMYGTNGLLCGMKEVIDYRVGVFLNNIAVIELCNWGEFCAFLRLTGGGRMYL